MRKFSFIKVHTFGTNIIPTIYPPINVEVDSSESHKLKQFSSFHGHVIVHSEKIKSRPDGKDVHCVSCMAKRDYEQLQTQNAHIEYNDGILSIKVH